jgi:hypothetical protein
MTPLPTNSTDETDREGQDVPSSSAASSSRRPQAGAATAVPVIDSTTRSTLPNSSNNAATSGGSTSNNNASSSLPTGALAPPHEIGSNQTAGAVSTAQTQRLEADVLAKQRQASASKQQTTSTPGAYQARSAGAAALLKPAALSELEGAHLNAAAKQQARSGTLESDVLAKQRGQSSSHTLPGAYSTPPTTTIMTLPELVTEQGDLLAKQRARQVNRSVDQLERDVMAKQQGRSAAAVHATAVDQLERDAMAKQQGRSAAAAAHIAVQQPGAYESTAAPTGKLAAALTQLSDAHDDIAAKQRGQTGRDNNGNNVVPPSALAALSLAEADVLVKDRARREPGMWSQLSTVEADVMAKANAQSRSVASPPDDDALQGLEDALTHKVLSSQANISRTDIELSQKNLLDKDFSALSRDAHQIHNESGGARKGGGLETGFSDLASEASFTDHVREKGQYHGDQDLEYGVHGGPNENGLAVAVAVSEDDDGGDQYLPSAIEYDPDAKPPMVRNRRFQLYGCLALVVAVVGIVGVSVGIVLSSTTTPPPPLPDRAVVGIRETIERLVGPDVFNDATHPYSQALDWIMNVDGMALTPNNAKLVQRFLAAHFYFSSSPWSGGCNAAALPGETDDCVLSSLARLDPITYVDIPGYRWLSSSVDECQWVGVECDAAGQLRTIRLRTFYWALCRIVDSRVAIV